MESNPVCLKSELLSLLGNIVKKKNGTIIKLALLIAKIVSATLSGWDHLNFYKWYSEKRCYLTQNIFSLNESCTNSISQYICKTSDFSLNVLVLCIC